MKRSPTFVSSRSPRRLSIARDPLAALLVAASTASFVLPPPAAAGEGLIDPPALPQICTDCAAGGTVLVVPDPGLRERVARACGDSPTLQSILAQLSAVERLRVTLDWLPQGALGRGRTAPRGETRWSAPPVQVLERDGSARWVGDVASDVGRGFDQLSLVGHELFHVLELARFGDIRLAPGSDGERGSKQKFETEGARRAERAIRVELARRGSAETHDRLVLADAGGPRISESEPLGASASPGRATC